mmetsp:Transcript_35287/g.34285  ORF Transcript_35287/g.34285 Transcript_35287/m.34285 type:complete len:122 (+) Transcript_35287:209-574(+)|eukprot:CAMPEP_0170548062 /NCGR_PEP_ID=MMETSP0211-20121228/6386_1 /TAXON_ID=311385 /ORGANISM="Pseudokeronopsis sp., Strain OXSARD2" /LENGTH=121 /DNA_ID=CAMNT_0010853379 /DNA_START=214 /DNA_END=579 /DNA_ORIENTATION=+
MPYASENHELEKVKFGTFLLAPTQQKKLNQSKVLNLSEDEVEKVQKATHELLKDRGYSDIRLEGDYLMARKDGESPQIGDIRIHMTYVPCGPTTVVAQQIQDDQGLTFRKWNPKKEEVPVG